MKYEIKIVAQVDGYDNFAKAQADGWELAGDIKVGTTHPNGEGRKMMHIPMKRPLETPNGQ